MIARRGFSDRIIHNTSRAGISHPMGGEMSSGTEE